MGRQEKSRLRCFGAAAVAGIYAFIDSILREEPIFWQFTIFAGFCSYRNYFRSLVTYPLLGPKTRGGMEFAMGRHLHTPNCSQLFRHLRKFTFHGENKSNF